MFKLLLVLFLSVIIHVQPQSNWYYDMGDDWEVSNRVTSANPYYRWYKQAAKQMDMYGYAKHVGKINRGQFFNPELNMPANRAFGYQSDFNPQDFNSGAFKYKPQGQKFRANAVHVNEGLASYVGEVRTMPLGQYVQEDGSILVQTSYPRGDPCLPNPCTNVRMPTCTVVNKFTARCTRNEAYKLTLTWTDPTDDGLDNDLDLLLVADYHDGTLCAGVTDYLNYEDDEECGALFSDGDDTDFDDVHNIAEESATLTTLADGTKYQDYTFALIVFNNNGYNPSEGRPTLTVEYNGVVKQTLAIPQYVANGPNLNYYAGAGPFRSYYFFGCFRPQLGYVDTRGAGFHDSTVGGATDTVVINGLGIFSPGLCQATLSWPSGYGFNPHEQSGSGDEQYSGNLLPIVFRKPQEFTITKSYQVTQLDFLGEEFVLSFDLFLTDMGPPDEHLSIIHLTIRQNKGKYGDRIPGIFLKNNKFHIRQDISEIKNKKKNFKLSPTPITTNTWMRFEVSQLFEKTTSKHMFRVKVDDALYWELENTEPEKFTNVKMFGSNPWYTPASGSIRNLQVQTRATG